MSTANRFTDTQQRLQDASFGLFSGAALVGPVANPLPLWGITNDGTLTTLVRRIRVQLVTAAPSLLSLAPAQASTAATVTATSKIPSTAGAGFVAKALQETAWSANPLEFIANGIVQYLFFQNQGDTVTVDFPSDAPYKIGFSGQQGLYLWNNTGAASGQFLINVTCAE